MACFGKKVEICQQKNPIEVVTDPFYSEANLTRLRRVAAEMDAGMGKVHELLNIVDDSEENSENDNTITNNFFLDNPLPSC